MADLIDILTSHQMLLFYQVFGLPFIVAMFGIIYLWRQA